MQHETQPDGREALAGANNASLHARRRPPLSSGQSSLSSSSSQIHNVRSEAEETNMSSTSTNALLRHGAYGGGGRDAREMEAMLSRLPSSPRDLMKRLEQQRDEMRLLREENVRLKSREVEVSSLTVKLQQQFAATQSQVDGIKAQIHLQLANPVTEEEYNRIDALPEPQRDLLETIKLGIYRQLGSLRASTQAATKRASELAATAAQLDAEKRDLELEVAELKATVERERETNHGKAKQSERQTAHVLELEATVKDLEAKLRSAFHHQEQFLTAKLTAQVKTEEAARLSMRLEEAEMDTQRYKANAECNEQKLDILKSEYYELKLTYSQRVLELESCLKAADEKLKTLGDLEMESELFISTLAQRERDGLVTGTETSPMNEDGTLIVGTRGAPMSYESYMALPRSRKLAHSLVVTKRCLHLENKVASLEHDVAYKDKQIARLQVSLAAARDALKNVNSPYAMVEKTLDELYQENERLKEKNGLLKEENHELSEKLAERTDDVKVLCKHRQELLRMRKFLRKLGVSEGYSFSEGDADEEGEPASSAFLRREKASSRTGHRSSSRRQPPSREHESLRSDRALEPLPPGDLDRSASTAPGGPLSSQRLRSETEMGKAMPSIEISS